MNSVAELSEGQLIAIDGKRLHSSGNDKQSAIHMVTAFATHNGMVLSQLRTEDKSNEVTAIPALLKLLDIKGCLISIDAIGCQTQIASTILNNGGDYLLAVKKNQRSLHDAVVKALANGIKDAPICIEQGHGRYEARAYHVLDAQNIAQDFPQWQGLNTLGVALGYRVVNSQPSNTLEYRYYISSARLNKAQFAYAVRGHWGIENNLHWVLDVAMQEDKCQINRGNAAETLSRFRHMALNMLRAENSEKLSIPRKQQRAWASTDYLEKALVAGIQSTNNK